MINYFRKWILLIRVFKYIDKNEDIIIVKQADKILSFSINGITYNVCSSYNGYSYIRVIFDGGESLYLTFMGNYIYDYLSKRTQSYKDEMIAKSNSIIEDDIRKALLYKRLDKLL